MNNLQILIDNYLEYCKKQKRLDSKTINVYQIDLRQFSEQNIIKNASDITSDILENYIATLHQQYKTKTVKQKIASLKALFHYFEYKNIITVNPFNKIQLRFQEPTILPKTIPLHTIETFLSSIYNRYHNAPTTYQRDCVLRDATIIELLFATGMRILELCTLKINDVDLYDRTVLIYGKGRKERIIQIGNDEVIVPYVFHFLQFCLPLVQTPIFGYRLVYPTFSLILGRVIKSSSHLCASTTWSLTFNSDIIIYIQNYHLYDLQKNFFLFLLFPYN